MLLHRWLEALHTNDLDLSTREVLEALWLARHMQSGDHPSVVEPAPTSEPPEDHPSVVEPAPTSEPPEPAQQPTLKVDDDKQADAEQQPALKVYVHEQADTEQHGGFGVPFTSPTTRALSGTLALGRAVRPLKQKVPVPTASVLDEAATVQAYAETAILLPMFRAATERRFDVVLVVDQSRSMVIWHELVDELQQFLGTDGGFSACTMLAVHGTGR